MRIKFGPVQIFLIILIVLLLLQNVHTPNFRIGDVTLFAINGRPVTLFTIISMAVIAWLTKILPSPFRELLIVILVLWILSLLGIFVFAWLSNVLMIVVVLLIIFYLFSIF